MTPQFHILGICDEHDHAKHISLRHTEQAKYIYNINATRFLPDGLVSSVFCCLILVFVTSEALITRGTLRFPKQKGKKIQSIHSATTNASYSHPNMLLYAMRKCNKGNETLQSALIALFHVSQFPPTTSIARGKKLTRKSSLQKHKLSGTPPSPSTAHRHSTP